MNFFFCKNESCKKNSCNICKKEVPHIKEGYDEDEEEYKLCDKHEVHFKCYEFKEIKEKFDLAIKEG